MIYLLCCKAGKTLSWDQHDWNVTGGSNFYALCFVLVEVLSFVVPRNRHRLEVQPNWMVKPRIGKELKGVDAQIAASGESLVESWGWVRWQSQWTRAELWGSSAIPVRPARPATRPKSSRRWLRQAGNSLTTVGESIRYQAQILGGFYVVCFINQTILVYSIWY